jgi:hypothetical protein
MPGGINGTRNETFFSAVFPGPDAPCDEEKADEDFNYFTAQPYYADLAKHDCVIWIDVAHATQLRAQFYQTSSFAVLTQDNIPADCIVQVTDLYNRVTYYSRPNPSAIGNDELASIKTEIQPLQYVGDARKLRSLFLHHQVFFSEADQIWRPRTTQSCQRQIAII